MTNKAPGIDIFSTSPDQSQDLFQVLTAPPKPPRTESYPSSSRNRLEPEYAPTFRAWKADPTPATAAEVIRAVSPILDTATRPLGNSPNLRTQAKHVALKALQNYDPERASLRTHLMSQLQGLRRYAGQQDNPIQIPERFILQQRALQRATADLQDQAGREPSDTELSEATGISPKRIAHIRRWRRPLSEGQTTGGGPDNEEGQDQAVHQATPEGILHDFIYSDLNPRDQLIMDYSLGRNGREQLNSREIARRVGVTPGLVSQRLAGIQQRLNSVSDMQLFGG